MLRFKRIYFDANQLLEGGWPRGNLELTNVLCFAGELCIPVFIPEPVERELEERWVHEALDKTKEIRARVQGLSKHCRDIVAVNGSVELPNENELRDAYRVQAKALRDKWGISVSPLTTRSLREVFEMSVSRKQPFKSAKDKNFQDTVIYLSIIDHLRSDTEPEAAAFVTRDGVFQKDTIGSLDTEAGVTIVLYQTLKEIADALKTGLAHKVQLRLEQDRVRACEVLTGMLDEIGKHISKTVTFSDRELFTKILAIKGIENTRIGQILLPFEPGPEPFEFYFDVALDLLVEVKVFRFPVLRPASTDDASASSPLLAMAAAWPNPVIEEARKPRVVTMKAIGAIQDGKFRVVELGFAYEKSWFKSVTEETRSRSNLADILNDPLDSTETTPQET